MTAPDLRASDADRDRVAVQLRDHLADGRLTLDEFTERHRRGARGAHGRRAGGADARPARRRGQPSSRRPPARRRAGRSP